MVTLWKGQHSYEYDFSTTTLAYFMRYPNPFARHVSSCDVISQKINSDGSLEVERLIRKSGKLPLMLRSLLGNVSDTFILETIKVDRRARTMHSHARNIDNKHILRVDEVTVYNGNARNSTSVDHYARFTSNIAGLKHRIEQFSRRRFQERIQQSREGMKYVLTVMAKAHGTWLQPQPAA